MLFLKSLSTEMLIVSSNGVKVNKGSMSKLVIWHVQSEKGTSENENGSLIV